MKKVIKYGNKYVTGWGNYTYINHTYKYDCLSEDIYKAKIFKRDGDIDLFILWYKTISGKKPKIVDLHEICFILK